MVKNVEPDTGAWAFAASAVSSYSRQLHAYLRRRVRRVEDLDDLAQEVYLRLLRIGDVDAVRNPLAYIYGVASHVVGEFYMRDQRNCVLFDSAAADLEAGKEGVAAVGVVEEGGAYFEQQMNEALRQLSAKHLAVLLLERRDGLTHAQIAEKLDLSVHTVKKYGVQALAHVRASLER